MLTSNMSNFEKQVLDEVKSLRQDIHELKELEMRRVLDHAITEGLSSGEPIQYTPGYFTEGNRSGDEA